MQDDATDELHVEVPHAEGAPAGFADDRERLRQQVVEALAGGEPLAELRRLRPKLFVGQDVGGVLERVDGGYQRRDSLEFAFVLGADDLSEESA